MAATACAAEAAAYDEPAAAHDDDVAEHTELLRHRCRTDRIFDGIATALAVSRKYTAGVEVAEADGYVAASPCESSAEGTMGIHYVHPEKIAAPPDLADPPILVYLPTPEGLELVAIEYFQAVIQDGQPYMGSASEPPRRDSLPRRPPELFPGQPFDGPMPGHNPEMPWHYDQHVWLYADNPAGLLAMWNPAIECPADE